MVDLHLHLDGSLTAEDAMRLAEIAGVSVPDDMELLERALKVSESCSSLSEYLEKFDLPLSLLQSEQAIAYAVRSLIERLEGEGLLYAEIRFAPMLHTKGGVSYREVVKTATESAEAACRASSIKVNLILCCMRGASLEDNLEVVAAAGEFLGRGVVALDLAGDEAKYPTELYAEVFAAAKKKGIPFTIHAGEAAGYDQVGVALDMGAARIGHGIRAAQSDRIMSRLSTGRVLCEMCYRSNFNTGAIKAKDEFPIREFIAKGVPFCLNTDNKSVSATDLRGEYLSVREDFALGTRELFKLLSNAIEAAFLSEKEKSELLELCEDKFPDWLESR